MNVPTANVIVAFDKDTMDRLFSAGATYSSLVKQVSDGDEDVLLFNNVSNPNFVSFEHELNNGGGLKMSLSFIDPKGEFENRFLTDNPARLISSVTNPDIETTKASIKDPNRQYRDSLQQFTEPQIKNIKDSLTKDIGTREFFVAYGVGDNLSLWSGPHRTVLANADIAVEGARKITITLVPTLSPLDISNRRGAFNEEVNLNFYGLKIRFSGDGRAIDFESPTRYDPIKYLDDYKKKDDVSRFRSETNEALTNLKFDQLVKQVEKYDFHCMVVDAIRNYVQKATNTKNVVVLLPNLNVVCRQAIFDAALNYNRATAPPPEDNRFDAGSFFRGSRGIAGPQDMNYYYGAEAISRGDELNFVREVLKSFGMELYEITSRGTRQPSPISGGSVGYFQDVERNANPDDRFMEYADTRVYYPSINAVENNVPDHVQVLSKVFNSINKLSRSSQKISIRDLNMTETQTQLLKIWGDEGIKESWTFGGYDHFAEDSTAVIIGDDALIKQYLYAKANVQNKEENVQKLRSFSKKAKIQKGLMNANMDAKIKAHRIGLDNDIRNEIEESNTAVLSEIPLHPLDRATLTDVQYNKRVREAVTIVPESSIGPFGDISYYPDTFSIQDEQFDSLVEKEIKKAGVSVFRYNTQNPNVLNLNFKFGGVYLAGLKLGYQKKAERLASKVAEGVFETELADFPVRGIGSAVAYLQGKGLSNNMGDEEQNAVIELLANKISPELVESLGVNNEQEAAMHFAALLLSNQDNNLRGIIELDQYLSDTPINIFSDMVNDLYRKANMMSITTLPMFHVSNSSDMNTRCLVLAQDQNISQSIKPNRTLMNRFFSGLYKFVGFRHVISTSDVVSEFVLSKHTQNYSDEQ